MIAGLLGGLWAKLLAGGAILLGLLGIAWRVLANAKNAGRTEQRLEDANAGLAGRLEAKEKVDAVRDDVDRHLQIEHAT